MKKHKVFNAVLLIIGMTILLSGAAYNAGYRLNVSVSYPTGLYRLTDDTQEVRVGELVLFCPPNTPIVREAVKRGYFKTGRCTGGFQPVIKKVVALSGTHVSLRHEVTLGGVAISHATVKSHDSKNRSLPALKDFIIPDDHVFMLSDYAPTVSFDSRYYGSVPIDNIQGHIIPIWTTDHSFTAKKS